MSKGTQEQWIGRPARVRLHDIMHFIVNNMTSDLVVNWINDVVIPYRNYEQVG